MSIGNQEDLAEFFTQPLMDANAVSTIYTTSNFGSLDSENDNSLSGICQEIDEILKDTFGCIIYQEQVMQIVQAVFKMTLGEADTVRRAIGRKDPELMKKMIQDMRNHERIFGITDTQVEHILKTIEVCSGYLFNKSHSAAYAYTAYQTAYLKTFFPLQFYTALLNANIDQEKTVSYLQEIEMSHIDILFPDIVKSSKEWKVEGDSLRVGLSMIRGVGNVIFTPPTTNDLDGFKEFLAKNPRLNKQVYVNLLKARCFPEVSPLWGEEYINWFKTTKNREDEIRERMYYYSQTKPNVTRCQQWSDKLKELPPEPTYYDTPIEKQQELQKSVLGITNVDIFSLYDDTLANRSTVNDICQVNKVSCFVSKKNNPTIMIDGESRKGLVKYILTTTEEKMEKARTDIKEGDILTIRLYDNGRLRDRGYTMFGNDYIHAQKKEVVA